MHLVSPLLAITLTNENILLVGSVLLFWSIVIGKTSFRFGVPTLLLFLGVGMLAGSDGLIGIEFENARAAQFVGIVALNFILFSGGLETDWKSVRPVLAQGVALSTLGVLLTCISVGVFVFYFTSLSIYESLLLGAVVSSTDAAAVFSILRAKNLGLKYELRPTLELESGSNDPMAFVLTTAMLGLVLDPAMSVWSLVPTLLLQMGIGAACGLVFGKLGQLSLNRLNVEFDGLYPVMAIAIMFTTFSITQVIYGNGFLAVYICGVFLGNKSLVEKKLIIKSFDGYSWLMQISLFLTLGLLVFPSKIGPVIGLGITLSLFLIFVARPLAVFITFIPFRMPMRRRLYTSWVGLRGASPIVFATYPLVAGVDKAEMIFHLVFFISVTSVLIQGTTLAKVAKWLKLDLPAEEKPLNEADFHLLQKPRAVLREIVIPEGTYAVGRKIIDLGIPDTATVTMIKRQEAFLTPNRSTVVEADDTLIVLATQTDADFMLKASDSSAANLS